MSYNVSCIKCKTKFVSEDEADYDGEAFCEACKQLNKETAQRVDNAITARRLSRQPHAEQNVYQNIRDNKNKHVVHYMNIGR